jgi:hypothetical protein
MLFKWRRFIIQYFAVKVLKKMASTSTIFTISKDRML